MTAEGEGHFVIGKRETAVFGVHLIEIFVLRNQPKTRIKTIHHSNRLDRRMEPLDSDFSFRISLSDFSF